MAKVYLPIFPNAKRGYQYRGQVADGPDVTGVPWIAEAKTYEIFSWSQLYKTFEEIPDDQPALVHLKENRREAIVFCKEKHLPEIIKRIWRYRDEDGKAGK